MKLWEIGVDLEAVARLIEANGGEMSPEIEARLDEIEGEFDAKVERIALLVRMKGHEAEAAKAEKDRLGKIQKAAENTAKSLRAHVQYHMEHHGKDTVFTPRVRVRVKQSSRPKVEWRGELEDCPYLTEKVTQSIDKAAVLEAYESSSDDPGERRAPEGFDITFSRHIEIR